MTAAKNPLSVYSEEENVSSKKHTFSFFTALPTRLQRLEIPNTMALFALTVVVVDMTIERDMLRGWVMVEWNGFFH